MSWEWLKSIVMGPNPSTTRAQSSAELVDVTPLRFFKSGTCQFYLYNSFRSTILRAVLMKENTSKVNARLGSNPRFATHHSSTVSPMKNYCPKETNGRQ